MADVKLKYCDCCGQVITTHLSNAPERHINTIKELYGVSLLQMKTKTKQRNIVEARQHFWLLLCVEDEWSTPRAGRKTGDHDHTTVVYGIRQFAHHLLGTDKKASISEIVKAYWLAVGMPEEFANERAEKRKNGR